MNIARRDQAETELSELADVLRKFYAKLVVNDGKTASIPIEAANEVLLMVAAQALGLTSDTSA